MSRPLYYKLVGRLPVPVSDIREWVKAFEGNRIVAQTTVGPLEVSTVFLALDHSFSTNPDAPAILFETMIFDGGKDTYQRRYATWDEAEKGHAEAVEHARHLVNEAKTSVHF